MKPESESPSIWRFLAKAKLTSSELLVTEVPRALRGSPAHANFDLAFSLRQAEVLLRATDLHPIRRVTLWRAGRTFDPALRSLDAIHVMTALENRPIEVFLSYDLRQLEAAHDAGLPTVSPGMKS